MVGPTGTDEGSGHPRVQVAVADGDLRLTVGAETLEVPAVWLRDHSTDPHSRDPVSGQRLLDIQDLPVDLRLESASEADGMVHVVFAPDGHGSDFDAGELLETLARSPRDERNESGKHLWTRADEVRPVSRVPWSRYLADRAPVLRSVVRDGFALLSEVPTRRGAVTTVAESFGFVRETNYGRIFDVRIEEHASNLAFTGRAISPHTDNPYRDPVPTLQLLHCLHNSAEGGDSGLVDGFAAAALLREREPEAFEVLTRTRVGYRFASPDAHLEALAPLITLDAAGSIREIRFNNRSMQVPGLGRDRTVAFYAAYRAFADLLFDPGARLTFRLEPGDCLVFDNTRLLHARTAFSAAGRRHLQGSYADLDGLLSTLALLERTR